MRKLIVLLAVLAGSVFAQQVNQDIIPASTGLNLGHSNQQWNAFLQNVTIYGTCTYAFTGQACSAQPIGSFTVSTLPTNLPIGSLAQVTDASPAGSCTVGGGSGLTLCRWNGFSWAPIGGGGSSSFSGITPGTNTLGAMVVGSGSSMTTSGSGFIGGTGAFTSITSQSGFQSVSPSVPSLITSVDPSGTCSFPPSLTSGQNMLCEPSQGLIWLNSGAGNSQMFSTALPTSSAFINGAVPQWVAANGDYEIKPLSGAAAAFSSLGSGTNTTAAMVVGTGSSLSASGSGTITATSMPFGGLTSGTNNAGSMTVGSGSSLLPSGSGTITMTNVQSGSSLPGLPCAANQLFNLTGGAGVTDTLYRCAQTGSANGLWQQIKPTVETIYAKDYGVLANARIVEDVTTSNTSKTVTCPNSDCNFVNATAPAGDVGKIVWVQTTSTSGVNIITQDTIATVNSAQSITVTSNAANANATGTATIVWGSDDSAGLDAAWIATGANCTQLQLPSGIMLVQQPEFNYLPSACPSANTFQVPNVFGASSTGTVIVPTPNFSSVAGHGCTGGSVIACFFGVQFQLIFYVKIFGLGQNGAAIGSPLMANNGGLFFDVVGINWCASCSGSTGYFSQGSESEGLFGGSVGFGKTACAFNGAANAIENWPCNGTTALSIQSSNVISKFNSFAGPVIIPSGTTMDSDNDFEQGTQSFQVAGNLYLNALVKSAAASPLLTTGPNGKITMRNTKLPASTATAYNGLNYMGASGSQLIDTGGDTFAGVPSAAFPAFLQITNASSASGTTLAKAFATNTTAGTMLIVSCKDFPSTSTINAPTDTLGNTWTQLGGSLTTTSVDAAAMNASLYYVKSNIGGADTVTCNFSAAVTSAAINIFELSGQNQTTPIDGSTTSTGNGTSVANAAQATSQSGDISVLISAQNTAATFSVGSCTPVACAAISGTGFLGAQFEQVPTATTPTTPGTWSAASDFANWFFNVKPYAAFPNVLTQASITGTVVTAAKLVLSGGWGNTPNASWSALSGYNNFAGTITAGTAGLAANPTITYTFPNPYVVPPQYCTATQVGGTQAQGQFTAGAPTATSVVYTYSGTPGASNTVILHGECYSQ